MSENRGLGFGCGCNNDWICWVIIIFIILYCFCPGLLGGCGCRD